MNLFLNVYVQGSIGDVCNDFCGKMEAIRYLIIEDLFGILGLCVDHGDTREAL